MTIKKCTQSTTESNLKNYKIEKEYRRKVTFPQDVLCHGKDSKIDRSDERASEWKLRIAGEGPDLALLQRTINALARKIKSRPWESLWNNLGRTRTCDNFHTQHHIRKFSYQIVERCTQMSRRSPQTWEYRRNSHWSSEWNINQAQWSKCAHRRDSKIENDNSSKKNRPQAHETAKNSQSKEQ